ncbi:NAD(P)-dependent alcohol dehydrogenase [Lapillicoccus sp.]|uniref:NAD(P)-dependent alcohol dehydrogenase n=1 Tax=Lapillicoccus sp. TaxID=1909287 RepID=UPI0032648AB1
MRAAVHLRYGPPEVVEVVEVKSPAVRRHDVLVKVYATTVSRTDCAYRAARPFFMRFLTGLVRPRVDILGCEFAGAVVSVGGGVTRFTVGDAVFGYNEGSFGAHAELLSIAENASLAVMPPDLTYAQAAAATEGAHYALSHVRAAKVRAGQQVLVNGATGAIGSAAVQLAKSAGATVTAVSRGQDADLVKGLGADRVIDYTVHDFTQDYAQAVTEDQHRYDVVLDAVGKSSFGRCRRILKPGGVYISTELGFGAQNPVLALFAPLLRSRRVLFPIPRHSQEMVEYLGSLMALGTFSPLVGRTYPLDQIVEAYRYVETGQKTGSVVIIVDPTPIPARTDG